MPLWIQPRITDLPPEALRATGVQGLLLDVDNTLTLHDSQVVPDAVTAWLQAARDAGLLLIIVSNARDARVAPFAAKLGLPYVSRAAKPLPFGFWRAAQQLGLPKKACLVIGDQIFTDMWGAALGGFPAAQLEPIEPEEGHGFLLFKRRLERPIRSRQTRRSPYDER